jgi:hypothetical protein
MRYRDVEPLWLLTLVLRTMMRYALGFVVRRDWNFAKSGKPAAIFQKLHRSDDPRK